MPDVFAAGDVVEFRSGDPREPWKLGEVDHVFDARSSRANLRLAVGPGLFVIRPARLCRPVVPAAVLNAGGIVEANAS